MFYLSLVEHKLLLPPHRLGLPIQDGIKKELELIFLDKVIADVGLCISVYDIRKIEGGFIVAGDGGSTYAVQFRMIMFRPFVGEIITAKLKESDTDGLHLSLGFFDDIHVPVHLLPSPSRFEPSPDTRYKVRWIWEYGDEFIIDGRDKIKFRVQSVKYPPMPDELEQLKAFSPMVITGTIDYDGLGPVSWWEESQEKDAEQDEES
ncbi:SHS2_Rpb7-N domain-containing protein/RNA_pol_Rbc25 domain-containing protein [Cephalotus follicularis]|uniref:DNA-directed RNA polymerase subunit n=1 Tax=Cephalotus follicularis TaxID=3775 RepID=A0A1Q3CJM7_CEPFO|nr:SHS2_Rpb7-N domain-containing protein/RNA_pol_Rbc25 domain-containing protein [Cephalotus follicularis]